MANFGTTMNNLSWNVTNGFLAGAMGAAFDTIQSKLANNGRDQKVKYYWEYEKGGAIYSVAVSALSDVAMSEYKKLIGGKKLDTKRIAA